MWRSHLRRACLGVLATLPTTARDQDRLDTRRSVRRRRWAQVIGRSVRLRRSGLVQALVKTRLARLIALAAAKQPVRVQQCMDELSRVVSNYFSSMLETMSSA